MAPELKTCRCCKVDKPLSDYYLDKRDNRLFAHCKQCHTQMDREYRLRGGPKPKPDYSQRTEKACSVCKQIKPLTDFYKTHVAADGYAWECKACSWAKEKKRRAADPGRVERLKASKERNKAKYVQRIRNYEKRYKEKRRQIDANRYASDPEKQRQRVRDYLKANPAQNIMGAHRYRVKMRGNGGKFTAKEWLQICERYGQKCVKCGKQTKLTIDHIRPVILGGRHEAANIQPLCGSCNSSKRDKHIDYRPESEHRGIELSIRLH